MRKKFLSAFLLGALAIATTSTMVSCKDYDDDINSLKSQLKTLEGVVDQKEQAIKTSIADLQTQINKANEDHATKAALEEAKKALQSAIDANYATLTAKDAELSAAIQKAQAAADAAAAVAANNTVEIQKVAADLATANEKLNTLSAGLTEANTKIGQLEVALAAQKVELEKAIADGDAATLKTALDAVKALETKVKEADDALQAKMDEEIGKVNEAIEGLSGSLDDLQEAHNNYAAKVDEILNTKLPAIDKKISDVIIMINNVDAKYDKLTAILANKLRSLVYQPSLYVDGIEAIEYPYLDGTVHELTEPYTLTRKHSYETVEVNLSELRDYAPTKDHVYYGPAWPVPYHMNPSTTTTAYSDIKGWNEREVEALTRVKVGELGISSPEKYDNGKQLFSNLNGTLTVGLKIANPELLKKNGPITTNPEGETGCESYGLENIIAIQAKSQTTNNADTLITSDYAMIYGEPVQPEAIIWTKDNNRGKVKVDIDEECPHLATDKVVHVFDTPEEALKTEPSFDLAWDDKTGITLSEYLASHYIRDCKTKAKKVPGTWAWGEEKEWGLHYEFETVEYKSSANTTIDSRYCVLDPVTGNIQARAVETTADGGKTLDVQGESSVDREPLVRVKLMQGKTVVLDAYILVRITKSSPEKQVKEITDYTKLDWKLDYDFCNGESWGYTTWDNFTDWVLRTGLDKEMTKQEFDAQYTIDGTDVTPIGTPVDTKYFDCVIYKDIQGTQFTWTDAAGHTSQIGTIKMRYDEEGLNNHGFKLNLTDDEIEYLTHDQDLPVVVPFYVRFNGSVTSTYKYVYIKFTTTIDRKAQQTGIQQKNDNYWFAFDGADEGWDAVAYDLWFPENGGSCNTWTSQILETFNTNKVNVTNSVFAKTGRKFFFVPVNTTITDHDGVEWIITPRKGANDKEWNALECAKEVCSANVCKNNLHSLYAHVWPTVNPSFCDVAEGTDNAKLGEILKKCAVDYTAGAFANTELYAVTKAAYATQPAYHKIAGLNAATGEIQLVRSEANYNECLDMIINAIGYAENHSNIMSEFHAWTGVAVDNGCEVVVDAYNTPGENNKTYSIWASSWQRPINFENKEPRVIEDANTNGDFIPVYDLLKFYDWRGPVKGDMSGENHWFWAYYNIHSIKMNFHPDAVTTDMDGGTLGVTKLSEKSSLVHLMPATAMTKAAVQPINPLNDPYSFDFDLSRFNSANRNLQLIAWIGSTKAKAFGYIYYENNGTNVTDFTVRIPVDVCYEWGHFSTYVDVTIKRTQGN